MTWGPYPNTWAVEVFPQPLRWEHTGCKRHQLLRIRWTAPLQQVMMMMMMMMMIRLWWWWFRLWLWLWWWWWWWWWWRWWWWWWWWWWWSEKLRFELFSKHGSNMGTSLDCTCIIYLLKLLAVIYIYTMYYIVHISRCFVVRGQWSHSTTYGQRMT